MRRPLLVLLAAAGAAGCINLPSPVVGLESLEVTLVDPPEGMRGTDDNPVTISQVTIDVRAVDAKGKSITVEEDLDVDVYLSFGGNKVGTLTPCGKNKDRVPLKQIHLTKGVAKGQTIPLTRAFSRASLWVEEHVPRDVNGEFINGVTPRAYGGSSEIVFPHPKIPDVQTPLDLAGPTATYCVPLSGQQVNIVSATGTGKLIVSSVFTNSYVVSDTGAGYDRTTNTGGFNNLYVFTFGRPPYYIESGRVMNSVSGNLTKFVGFTELSFPQQSPISTMDKVQLPPPFDLKGEDQSVLPILMRLSGATVRVAGSLGASICPIDVNADDWKKYSQFQLKIPTAANPFGLCNSLSGFTVALPAKTIGDFDPLQHIGGKIEVVGMFRNNSGQNEATAPPTLCDVTDPNACASLGTPKCVEGTCKKGPYNFFSIVVRDGTDITLLN